MPLSPRSLRQDAFQIWRAGVSAVDSARLVRNVVHLNGRDLHIADEVWSPSETGRICVVGAGKAGAGMASGFLSALPEEWRSRVSGWVNVPGDCVNELEPIHLHAARPAGVNEPTQAGVEGTRKILSCVGGLSPEDLCLVLISGGGSALLPAPVEGVSLEDKQQVTRILMQSGATIRELNAVRRALSQVKGGGLLRACQAGKLIALIISDVIGDPLETIASGPTFDLRPDPQLALTILNKIAERTHVSAPPAVRATLARQLKTNRTVPEITRQYSNHVIGNNQTAVEAAADQAEALGYEVVLKVFDQAGVAAEFGRDFADRCLQVQQKISASNRVCLISGGEPVVHLTTTHWPRKGGRNQELVLAAAKQLQATGSQGIVVLSAGTDGEDGPTDAAGAVIDSALLEVAAEQQLHLDEFLEINNSYPFFEKIGGLIKTGPTHTNVMDLRIGLIGSDTLD